LQQLLAADVGSRDRRSLEAHDCAIVMGDFNLDSSASPTNMHGAAAVRGYDGLAARGFVRVIPAVRSSLISVFNNKWKAQGMTTKYDGAGFVNVHGGVTNFTSSAYDNIFIRGGALRDRVWTGCVVDVLGWIKTQIQLGKLALEPAKAEWNGFQQLDLDQQAFFIYRVFVSDHLPVLLDVLVAPQPPDFQERARSQLWIQRLAAARSTVRRHELEYASTAFLNRCPPVQPFYEELPRTLTGIGMVCANQDGYVIDFGPAGARRAFPPPIKTFGAPTPGEPVAVICRRASASEPPHTYAVCGLARPEERFLAIDADYTLVVGRVTAISKDGTRFRLVIGTCRCTFACPTPDDPPPKGSFVVALLKGCLLKDVVVAVKPC
jgi:hypothetical protein